MTYWVPGLPRLTPDAWEVGSGHFAERFQLFIIIALGESIVITGSTTASHELTTATIVAFGLAFLITAALWWLYFNLVAGIAERRLAQAVNRTVLARDAYTYLHVVIVAGILLTAVGDEIVIAHPTEELKDAELAAVVSGPALYLLARCCCACEWSARSPGGGSRVLSPAWRCRGGHVRAGAGGRRAAVRGAGGGDRGRSARRRSPAPARRAVSARAGDRRQAADPIAGSRFSRSAAPRTRARCREPDCAPAP